MVYALDRISDCGLTDKYFELDKDFDIDNYFRGCCGVIHSTDEPVRVELKAYGYGADYLRTLPIHSSQRELQTDPDGTTYFELYVCPTYDLYQELLLQVDQIEVISPQFVRNQIRTLVQNILTRYKQ